MIFDTKATMDATLTYPADTPALVIGDATAGNNGLYRKSGASGSGSWVRITDMPGYSFVRATNTGAGTANEIVATTGIPVNESQLLALTITATNTATPVTVAFNGEAALTIKTNSGNNPAIGGLTTDTVLAGYVSGSVFRLLSDQASAAIQAAAEDALTYAEEWANKDEDDPVSVAAGGDGSTDFSAKHWAAKASADVASVVARRFNYLADAEVASINEATDFVQVDARTEALGGGTGGVYTRQVSDPGHAWSFQSADGAFWAISGKQVTPETGGFTNLHAAVAAAAAANYTEVYLDSRPRNTLSTSVARNTANGSPLLIVGPGLGLVTKLNSSGIDYGGDSELVVGQWADDNMFRHPKRVAQTGRRSVEHTRTTPLSTTLFRTTAQAIANNTVTQVVTGDYRDRAGGYYSGGPSSFWCGNGGFRRIAVHGNVHFAASATGARQVMLFKNGSLVETLGVEAASIGVTTVTFYFEVDVIDGDYLGIYVYQTSGGSLNVSRATAKYEVIEQDIRSPIGTRGLIFQGYYNVQETRFGGFQQMVSHIAANYDCLILSHVGTYNDDDGNHFQTPSKMWFNTKGAWTNSLNVVEHERWHDTVDDTLWIAKTTHTSAGSGTFSADRAANPELWVQAGFGDDLQVQSTGYPRMRRLVRALRALRPDIEIFGYVTAAADAPYWDSSGNPRTEYAGARGYNNVIALIGQWIDDGLDIDGIFFDHFGPPFINSTVRNTVLKYLRDRGLRGAYNCLSPGVAAVLFATEAQLLQAGDILAFEGFYRDDGKDTNAATNAMLSELAKHRGRDIRLYAGIEGRGMMEGKVTTPEEKEGLTYWAYGTAVTVTCKDSVGAGLKHTMVDGDKVYIETLDGELPDGVYTVTSHTPFTFAFTADVSMSNHHGACNAYPKQISPYAMDPNALDYSNGKSLFDSFDRPGDVVGWATLSYNTM